MNRKWTENENLWRGDQSKDRIWLHEAWPGVGLSYWKKKKLNLSQQQCLWAWGHRQPDSNPPLTTPNQSHLGQSRQLINQLKPPQSYSSEINQSCLRGRPLLRARHQIVSPDAKSSPWWPQKVETLCRAKIHDYGVERKLSTLPWHTRPGPEYSCRGIGHRWGAQLFITSLQKETHHCPTAMEY